MRNDDDESVKRGNNRTKPARDARGRWQKGHCPNPKGRPRKKLKEYQDLADIRMFGNTLIDVRTSDGPQQMTRRAALIHKIYEDAMQSKAAAQRFLYNEFAQNDVQLAEARLRYDQLMTEWVIKNKEFKGLDDENIPFDVQSEIAGLEALLNHYFPAQYPRHHSADEADDIS